MSKEALTVVQGMQGQFEKALPAHFTPERFTRIAMTAISKDAKLARADRNTLLGSLMMFAQLGLEPNTPLGHAYLVPFGNKITPIVGYKGLIDLAYRTGNYEIFDAHCVYAKDEFSYEYGFNQDLKHKRYSPKPDEKYERGLPTHYYAFYKLKNGGRRFRVWTRDECIAHGKKYSKSFHKGPWKDNTDSMCLKTVIKDLLSLAPMSPEDKNNVALISADNQLVTYDENTQQIDIAYNDPKETEAENKSVEAEVLAENKELGDLGLS